MKKYKLGITYDNFFDKYYSNECFYNNKTIKEQTRIMQESIKEYKKYCKKNNMDIHQFGGLP